MAITSPHVDESPSRAIQEGPQTSPTVKMRTLSFFVILLTFTKAWNPIAGLKQAIYFNAPSTKTKLTSKDGLYPEQIEQFGPLDDVVMGGSSSSKFENGKWSGSIVTANGGFCGIRSQAFKLDATGYKGFELEVKGGGGQRVKFSTKDGSDWNGVAWIWEFDTKANAVTKVRLPFAKAIPTKFAKTVDGAVLSLESLTSVQFTLSKFSLDGKLNPKFKGDGTFQIEILSIRLYK